jgi:nitrilase
MAPTKVAAVQASPVPFNLQASLKKLCELVETASDEGAQLVVFPEAFLSCYPRFLGFRIGMRTDDDREAFAQYVKVSRDVRERGGSHGS